VVFELCLRDATRVGSLASWERLLKFASCLRKPRRGGRRFNLTSQISAQIDMFDSGQILHAPVTALPLVRGGARAPRRVDANEGAAARASIKREFGDVGGAVRAITSDSSYVVPGTESYEELLTKHPCYPLIDAHLHPLQLALYFAQLNKC